MLGPKQEEHGALFYEFSVRRQGFRSQCQLKRKHQRGYTNQAAFSSSTMALYAHGSYSAMFVTG